jgi:hypothetical protein
MFSKEILKNMTEKELARFEDKLEIYHTFAQSHDYLFYYKFGKNRKEINALGRNAHHKNTQEYLINIIKEIKDNHQENNPELIAYLYGSITHYVLDSTCHPYIFYKTGVYRKKDPDTRKYFGGHNQIEKELDAIYYKKYTGKDYKSCNVTKEIIGKPKFSNLLIRTLNKVYEDTYDKENIGYYYQKGVNNARVIYNIVINDRFGIKKALYKFIDLLINKNQRYISTYSTYIKKPNLNYLNLEKKEWNHPSKPEIKYNYSFENLFEISIEKTIKIIKEINKVLYNNKCIEYILEYIPNLDYSTGLPLDNNSSSRYFEY